MSMELGHWAQCGLVLGLLLTGAPAVRAQSDCGTTLLPEQVDIVRKLEALRAFHPPVEPRFVAEIPMTMHVVRQSNGTGGIAEPDMTQTLTDANAHWAPSGVLFFQQGATRFIDSDAFFNIDSQAELDQLRSTDFVTGTLNVYFVNTLSAGGQSLCGISSFSFDLVQGIVINNSCTSDDNNTATFTHEIGHYFDLYHTHEVVFGPECPDGFNCSFAGDLLCDTPADPDLSDPGALTNCTYTGTETRCFGQTFSPDPANLMSYAGNCRDRFTEGQRVRSLGTLFGLRETELLDAGERNVTWLDFGYGGTTEGTFGRPYANLSDALRETAAGGTIVIKSGETSATIRIDQPVRLDSFRGPARIGD